MRWPVLRCVWWRQMGLNQTAFFFSVSSSWYVMFLGPFSKQKSREPICSWHGSGFFWNQDLVSPGICLAYSGFFWFHQPPFLLAQSYRYYNFFLYPVCTSTWQVSLHSFGIMAGFYTIMISCYKMPLVLCNSGYNVTEYFCSEFIMWVLMFRFKSNTC